MKDASLNECKNILLKQLEYKKRASILLSSYFQCEEKDLFYLYMQGRLPENGKISKDIFFAFHGLGCSIKHEQENWKIDLEFGPKGNTLAFDKGTICHLLNYYFNSCNECISYLVNNRIIELIDRDLLKKVQQSSKDNTYATIEEEIDASVADRYMLVN